MDNSQDRLAAVLFDMDGVLIDSNAVIERAWHEAAAITEKTLTREDIINHIHGQPGPHTLQALFGDLPFAAQQNVQAHVIDVENTANYDPVPGVVPLIVALNAAGVNVGIVTSGWQQKIDRVMATLQIEECISVIVERDDVSRGKPFPDPYLLAAKRLAIPASQTLVFEDSRSGVTSAHAAGAYCIGIGGTELLECGARVTIPDFTGVEVFSHADGDTVLSFCPGHQVMMKTRINLRR